MGKIQKLFSYMILLFYFWHFLQSFSRLPMSNFHLSLWYIRKPSLTNLLFRHIARNFQIFMHRFDSQEFGNQNIDDQTKWDKQENSRCNLVKWRCQSCHDDAQQNKMKQFHICICLENINFPWNNKEYTNHICWSSVSLYLCFLAVLMQFCD